MASTAGTTGKRTGAKASSPSGGATRKSRAKPAGAAGPAAKAGAETVAKSAARPATKPATKPAANPAGSVATGPDPHQRADSGAPVDSGPPLRRRELVDAVAERSGVRRKHARATVEAMLEILGAALAEGRELNLQPFGKISRKRVHDTAGAVVVTARIRQSKAATSPFEARPAGGAGEADPAPAEKSTQTVADAAE